MGLRSTLERFTRRMQNRIDMMLARGVILLADDSKKLQVVQVGLLQGETRELERFQPYGMTSNPPVGAEAVAVFRGGDRGHGMVLVVDDRRHRKRDLSEGEVALYDRLGKFVHLRDDGELEINSPTIRLKASSKIILDAPIVEAGTAGATEKVLTEAAIVPYNGHVHNNPGPTPDLQLSVDTHTTTKLRGDNE